MTRESLTWGVRTVVLLGKKMEVSEINKVAGPVKDDQRDKGDGGERARGRNVSQWGWADLKGGG